MIVIDMAITFVVERSKIGKYLGKLFLFLEGLLISQWNNKKDEVVVDPSLVDKALRKELALSGSRRTNTNKEPLFWVLISPILKVGDVFILEVITYEAFQHLIWDIVLTKEIKEQVELEILLQGL